MQKHIENILFESFVARSVYFSNTKDIAMYSKLC